MKYACTVISVSDVNQSRKFYEELFGLEVYQDYGINILFTCGLALQQEFDWLVNIPKEKIVKEANNIELCFEEEAFDDFIKQLEQYGNIRYLGDVIEHSWGQRVVRFYDPDGHIIRFGKAHYMIKRRLI
jgi:catechol 2,3-dioxygenase-like lactoylglutathione lyase family enzyme